MYRKIMPDFTVNTKPLRIMFDTNTYRKIIDCSHDTINSAEVYTKINHLIRERRIEALLSETLFTIEAIKKFDRLSFLSKYNPNIVLKERAVKNTIEISATIEPDLKHMVCFEETGPLKSYFEKALNLGFKLARLPRAGGIKNIEIDESAIYTVSHDMFNEFIETAGLVSNEITKRGAGEALILKRLSKYSSKTKNIFKQYDLLFADVNKLPDKQRKIEIKKVASEIAELSDGDSVACSIGLKCDAFCTNDRAVNAGIASVFSFKNVSWLTDIYGFRKLTPTELIEFINK